MPEETTPAKRLTLSTILELMLSRGTADRSSVTLSRNAKGDTQIEVTVRTGEAETVLDAERQAKEVYDRLRDEYPSAAPAARADGS